MLLTGQYLDAFLEPIDRTKKIRVDLVEQFTKKQ